MPKRKSAAPKARASKAPNSSLGAIEKMIMFPEATSVEVIRMRDDYNNLPTATCKPYNKQSVSWDPAAVAAAGQQLPDPHFAIACFRDPLRAFIVYNKNPGGVGWNYEWQAKIDGINTPVGGAPLGAGEVVLPPTTNGAFFPLQQPDATDAGITEFIDPIIAEGLGGTGPHGPFLHPGKYQTRRGFWIDTVDVAGFRSTLRFEAYTPAGVLTPWGTGSKVSIFRWDGIWRLYAQVSAPNPEISQLNVTLLKSGYYAVGDVVLETPAGGVNPTPAFMRVIQFGNCSTWSHFPVEGINNQFSVKQFRTLAYSARISNRNAEIFKSGSVVACNILPGESWTDKLLPNNNNSQTNTAFTEVGSDEFNSRDFQFTKGFYGYGKVAQTSDLKMRTPFKYSPSSKQPMETYFNILDESPAFVVVVDATAQSGAQNQVFLSFFQAVEYNTEDVWKEHKAATVDKAAFEAAFDKLSRVPNFLSNEGAGW